MSAPNFVCTNPSCKCGYLTGLHRVILIVAISMKRQKRVSFKFDTNRSKKLKWKHWTNKLFWVKWNYTTWLLEFSIISIFSFKLVEQFGLEVCLVWKLRWTFAHSNHTAIMAISASLSLVLVQLPGVICKAAKQEMRLVCCSRQSLEDVLEGAALKLARWARRVPPTWRAWGSSAGGQGCWQS